MHPKHLTLACLLLLGLSFAVSAQDGPPGRGRRGMGRGDMPGLMLLGQKSVQEELKLTEVQIADATKAMEAQRTAMQGIFQAGEDEREAMIKKAREESDAAIAKILNADQAKRLAQIRLQLGGLRALSSEETSKALILTDDQKQQLAKIEESLNEERRGLFQNRDGDREANRKKMTELADAAKQKALAVLTDEQKTKWTELTGPAFTGEITFGGRGGFGGGREGRGPRGERPNRPESE